MTNGIRTELHHQGTLVVAVHAAYIDTDMAAMTNAPKINELTARIEILAGPYLGQIRRIEGRG